MFIELRRYIVKPEYRDEWVKIMEEKIFPFILPKGVVVLASFIALHDKSQYIWLRSFANDVERVRLYKAMYESEYWGKEIIPPADKMLEWEGIKNVKVISLIHHPSDQSLFIDYDLQKNDLVELKKYKLKKDKLSEWLSFVDNFLIPHLNKSGARVLDSFSLPEFEDTHILMTYFPSEKELNKIYNEIEKNEIWLKQALPLIQEITLETPLLISTDTKKFT